MTGYSFDFHGLRLIAQASGVLWWPDKRWLIAADLHLGKSERMARRGGPLLPPYEGIATLERLRAQIELLDPLRVISLGDGFDDLAAAKALAPALMQDLHAMSLGRDWIWIGGNHDPGAPMGMPGRSMQQIVMGPVTLRHEAAAGPDISGHFHPVIRLAGMRRRAFLLGTDHLILPAFGDYTGGLICDDPALVALVPRGLAIACGARPLVAPIGWPRRGAQARRT